MLDYYCIYYCYYYFIAEIPLGISMAKKPAILNMSSSLSCNSALLNQNITASMLRLVVFIDQLMLALVVNN